MNKVLVNLLGGLSLPMKSVVRLTDRPDMTLDVYRGRKTTQQQQQIPKYLKMTSISVSVWTNSFIEKESLDSVTLWIWMKQLKKTLAFLGKLLISYDCLLRISLRQLIYHPVKLCNIF